MSRKISGFNKPTTGTSKVVMEATSSKTQIKQTNAVFAAGNEYSASNFHKGATKPPKMRVLGFFTPLVNGLPNANNDTYIIFQIYDYSISAFRGPYCGANTLAAVRQAAPLDFYVSTIDKFGKNYGDLYSGNDGFVSATFTPPTINFVTGVSMNLGNMGGRIVTINAGHGNGVIKLQGQTNRTVNFHGFLSVSGYNGRWGLYSLSDNGTLKTFETTFNNQTYRSNTYPYLTPLTGKFASEWRYMPMCEKSTLAFHYFPVNNAGTNFGGGIQYGGIEPPVNNVFANAYNVDLFTDSSIDGFNSASALFSAVGINLYLDEQQVDLAPSGYYTTTTHYAYYDAITKAFSGLTAIGGSTPTLTEIRLNGPHPDSSMACMMGIGFPGAIMVYYDSNNDLYFEDSAGTSPFDSRGMYYFIPDTFTSVMIGNGSIMDKVKC